MILKECFKCKETKTLDMFYPHKMMLDGHLNKCMECTKKDTKSRYNNPAKLPQIKLAHKLKYLRYKKEGKKRIYQRNRRMRNKEKPRAYQRVRMAIIRGNLIRKPCEVCNNEKAEAHHEDYSKPLDVKWLCFIHHRQAHGQLKYIS